MMSNERYGVNLSATILVHSGKYKAIFSILEPDSIYHNLNLTFFPSDSKTSCDWSSCYDDVGFLEFLIERIGSRWCLDLNSIHLSGISNGGMFAYFLAAMSDDGIGKKIIFWQVF